MEPQDNVNSFLSAMDSVIETASNSPSVHSAAPRPVLNSEEFDRVVESRRSVRVFTGERIAPELMGRLVDLAMLSPSSSNLQPWEFHWVRSSELRAEIVKACLSQPAARTAGELLVIVVRTATWRRNIDEMLRRFQSAKEEVPKGVLFYYRSLIPRALQTGPLWFMTCAKWIYTRVMRYSRATPQEPIGFDDIRVWAHKSVALAAQTLMLAARAHNIDSCPMEGFDSWRVKRLLKLPRDAEISMILALGKAKPEGIYGERLRFSRDWFVFEH